MKFQLSLILSSTVLASAVFAQDVCEDARSIWPDVKDSGSVDVLSSFVATFPECAVYASLAKEKLDQLRTGDERALTDLDEMPSDALSMDDETCLTMASAPLQHEDFLGVEWTDIMVAPALEACERAYSRQANLNPEVRAVYARVLTKAELYDDAVQQALIAANDGSALAMVILSNAYEQGRGIEKDDDQSRAWLEKAAALQFPMAQHNLFFALRDEDADRALSNLKLAAEAGYGNSQFKLGNLYRKGTLVSEDLDEAMFWYDQAIEFSQHTDAMFWAAYILGGDSGSYPLDYERAVSLYERAASTGDKWAQHNLASMYFHGKGAYPNLEKATHYFGLAAEQGHVMAMRKYGRLLHESGDPEAAMYWYQQAAAEGDDVAAKLLAQMLGE
ncbi:tetratricopeptide repeat protein [Shimia sagamensis]|uniref:tetratricopeptide repeat protein n=1 Tax=Shimia sagamensis TaxID=1566352 RepID=UPI0024B7DC10|nr:tetratricopeptide repeat protein [Shimia sagamensis]